MQVGPYNGRHGSVELVPLTMFINVLYVPLTGAFIIWRHAQPKAIIMHMDQVALA
jgi:hypothetical protein